MAKYTSGIVEIPIYTFEDGINSTDPARMVGDMYRSKNGKRQVVSSLDLMFHTKKPRPAGNAINSAIAGRLQGIGHYLRYDGTDYLLAVVGGVLYRVDKSAGTMTALYTMSGTGQARFVNVLDKCIVANGTEVVKVEGTNAYALGIAAPAGVSAVAAAGGSLAAGVYKIYACYARIVDGATVLYSTGEAVTDVTLSGGNGSITFSFPNSSDAQVNNKAIFMTDAAGAVYYRYYQTSDNTTTSFTISSDTNKNSSILYEVEAMLNLAVPNFEHILAFNNYLYGSVDNVLYRSLQAGTVYDLERFDTQATGNIATYPFKIQGIFQLGEDIYLNTPGGLIRIPGGDINSEYHIQDGTDYFKHPETVQNWSGMLIGVTKNGIRAFDGAKFLPHDIGRDIKPQLQTILTFADADNPPCGVVFRRDTRTEYHLSYRDTQYGSDTSNRRLVLDLDKLLFLSDARVRAPWEMWSMGFSHAVVDAAGALYCGQSHRTTSTIYAERTSILKDSGVYRGDAIVSDSAYGWTVTTGTFVPSVKGKTRWHMVRLLAKLSQTVTVVVRVVDYPSAAQSVELGDSLLGRSLFGVAQFGVSRWTTEVVRFVKSTLKATLHSYGVYVTISQSTDDTIFEFDQCVIQGLLKETRFT